LPLLVKRVATFHTIGCHDSVLPLCTRQAVPPLDIAVVPELQDRLDAVAVGEQITK
jgi:hypothetical protein